MKNSTKEATAVTGAGVGGALIGVVAKALGMDIPIEAATTIAAAFGYAMKILVHKFQ